MNDLDSFDRKILQIVQRNNQTPQRLIAGQIGLSAPAVARRLQHLRASGYIAHDVSIVDQSRVDRPLTLIVEVSTENERLDLIDEMKRRFASSPQVQHCYYVTGEVDFILIMNVKDMAEYTQLSRELFFEAGNVKSFRTLVAMQRIKTDPYVIV